MSSLRRETNRDNRSICATTRCRTDDLILNKTSSDDKALHARACEILLVQSILTTVWSVARNLGSQKKISKIKKFTIIFSSWGKIIYHFSFFNLDLPEEADIECRMVIPIEFISESGDHIFKSSFFSSDNSLHRISYVTSFFKSYRNQKLWLFRNSIAVSDRTFDAKTHQWMFLIDELWKLLFRFGFATARFWTLMTGRRTRRYVVIYCLVVEPSTSIQSRCAGIFILFERMLKLCSLKVIQ